MEPLYRLLVTADAPSLRAIRRGIRQVLADLGIAPEVIWDVQLAVNELCTCLVLTAFPPDEPPGLIEVSAARERDELVVVVVDDGNGFDPHLDVEGGEILMQVVERITTGFDVFPGPYGHGSRVELRFGLRPKPVQAGAARGRYRGTG